MSSPLILEIRTYRIKPGQREAFHRLVRDETVPLVREFGMRVVRFGPSLHDDDSYLLIRAFRSLEERADQEERFYGSKRWLERYDQPVMAMIESYITTVVAMSETAIAAMEAASTAGA